MDEKKLNQKLENYQIFSNLISKLRIYTSLFMSWLYYYTSGFSKIAGLVHINNNNNK